MIMKTLPTEGAITNQKLSGERTLMIMTATDGTNRFKALFQIHVACETSPQISFATS